MLPVPSLGSHGYLDAYCERAEGKPASALIPFLKKERAPGVELKHPGYTFDRFMGEIPRNAAGAHQATRARRRWPHTSAAKLDLRLSVGSGARPQRSPLVLPFRLVVLNR